MNCHAAVHGVFGKALAIVDPASDVTTGTDCPGIDYKEGDGKANLGESGS